MDDKMERNLENHRNTVYGKSFKEVLSRYQSLGLNQRNHENRVEEVLISDGFDISTQCLLNNCLVGKIKDIKIGISSPTSSMNLTSIEVNEIVDFGISIGF